MKIGDISKTFAEFVKFLSKERGQKHDRTKAHKGQLAKKVRRNRRKHKALHPTRQQGGRKNRGRK